MSTITPHVSAMPLTPGQLVPRDIPADELKAIIDAAHELFNTQVVAELVEDPEVNESYYLLRMKVVRDVEHVAQLRKRWFELLRQRAPAHCGAVRLAVDYLP